MKYKEEEVEEATAGGGAEGASRSEGGNDGKDPHIKEEGDKKTPVKLGNTTKPKEEKTRILVKFEIDKKNEDDAIKMSRMIGRAANLKKETTHHIAKFLFEQCLAEYRANNLLE